MKALWVRYSERLDALTLRERAMIFAAAALVLGALLYALFIEPQLRRERDLQRQQVTREAESAKLQVELAKIAATRSRDPDVETRKRLAALREELARLDAGIVAEQKKFTAPSEMRALLEDMLSRNRRLRLMDLKSLPATTVSEGQEGPAKAGEGAAARLIYRHGVEITLAGTYLDMLRYLTELEKLPGQLYWGRMELTVEQYPTVTLKLIAYTLSLDRAWMLV